MNMDKVLFEEIGKLKNGESESTNRVYELSQKYIYTLINDIVKNHPITEDIMQETYMQVYNEIEFLELVEDFYDWAGGIATELTLKYIQECCNAMPIAEGIELSEPVASCRLEDKEAFLPETLADNKEAQKLIAEMVDNLPIEKKLTLQFYYYENMTVDRIAAVMGCDKTTIESRLIYIKRALKEVISAVPVKKRTKLYSMAEMPIFLMVFRNRLGSGLFKDAEDRMDGTAGTDRNMTAIVVKTAIAVGITMFILGCVGVIGYFILH